MNKHKKKIIFFIALVLVILGLITLFDFYYDDYPQKVKISMEVKSDRDDQYSVYYDIKGDKQWDENNCEVESYTKVGEYQKLTFFIPIETKNVRIDFGSVTKEIEIKNVNLTMKKSKELSAEEITSLISESNDIKEITVDNNITNISYSDKKVDTIDKDTLNNLLDRNKEIENININNNSLEVIYADKTTKNIQESEINDVITEVKNIENIKVNKDTIEITSITNDPYVLLDDFNEEISVVNGKPTYITVAIILLSLILGYITTKSLNNLKESIKFVKEASKNKRLIMSLAKNDFKQKFVSSYLGVVWGFINPLITIAVYWFVFQVGFRQGNVGEGIPFILWFIAGIIPWFFFTESLSACTNVFIEYSYLVKKVVFKIESLPIIKIMSSGFVHLFFILFLFVVSAVYSFYPDVYTLQVIYYLFAMVVLVFTVTVFTSAVVLFFRDLSQIINIIISVGFWATPIGWNLTMLPDFLQKIFKLNPIFYIVTGYRDSFVEKIFFWERPYHTLYFWCFCLIMLLVGVKVFNKLRPHFSDVI